MEPAEYLEETERAAQQLFEGLGFYRQILEEDPRPAFVAETNPGDEEAWRASFDRWAEENRDIINLSLQKQREYLGYTFSQGTLAGAILQIAHMGISLFSGNDQVPDAWADVIRPNSKPVRFCIGREVKGVPIGLIIYAARNQYNHWDEQPLHEPTREIFRQIATASEEYTDPAFDLNNPRLQTYSHNIVSILEWRTYDTYLEDMKRLICV